MEEALDDWSDVIVFGAHPQGGGWIVRPSAYALVLDDEGRLAVVETSQGTFLPGGGIEPGERIDEAIRREALEECGLISEAGGWTIRAIQFVYSRLEDTTFEKRSIFREGIITGVNLARLEPDHSLVWATWERAYTMLSHESQRWAIDQWRTVKA